MPRWLPRLLNRIRELASGGHVRLTLKAQGELAAVAAGLDIQDACDVLNGLVADDFYQRFKSERTDEWMYVFKPTVVGIVSYLKAVVRSECVVISFHEDEGQIDEEP